MARISSALFPDPDSLQFLSMVGSFGISSVLLLYLDDLPQVGIRSGIPDTGSTLLVNGIYHYIPRKPLSHGYTTGVYTASASASASGSKSSR